MKNTIKFLAAFALLTAGVAQAQVGVGTTTPDASAALDVDSTTGGLLLPRMTTLQRNAIATPATGLVIYNTDFNTTQTNVGTPSTPEWVSAGGQAVFLNPPRTFSAATNIDWGANDYMVIVINAASSGLLGFPTPTAANAGRILYIYNAHGSAINFVNPGPGNEKPVGATSIASGRCLGAISTGTEWYPLTK